MTLNIQDYAFWDDQGYRISPCIDVNLFTDTPLALGPHPGMLNFYEAFRKRFGQYMGWYKTNTDSRFKKIKPAKLDMVPFWFADPRSKKDNPLGFEMRPGHSQNDMQVPSFQFFCGQTPDLPAFPDKGLPFRPAHAEGNFRICLPLDHGFETLTGMLSFLDEALAEFPFVSGYVGYSLYWNDADTLFERDYFNQQVPRVHMRVPGLGQSRPMYWTENAIYDGLVDIGWITLLGKKTMGLIGGCDKLAERLAGTSAQVRSIPGEDQSFMVIACDAPQLGDLEAGDSIPAYQAVGWALRDLRAKREHHYPGFSLEAYNKWRSRFFGES